MKAIALLSLILIVAFVPLYGGTLPSTILGSGEPGLHIIYKGTNQFVIYVDEPWTVGSWLIGGMPERHLQIICDRNYGLKERIQSLTGKIDTIQQLYPFDDQRAFTCDLAVVEPDPKTGGDMWPHQNMLISLDGDSLSVSDDVYALARHQYGLTTNQVFLGKIGTNVFYWEMGDPRKAYCRAVGEKQAAVYFELPKGMIDLFGVAKGVKKDVGFVVLKKSTGFFRYSSNEFVFLEFSLKDAKRMPVSQ
jgi:hypothetical protein